jgi:hypothetical protein
LPSFVPKHRIPREDAVSSLRHTRRVRRCATYGAALLSAWSATATAQQNDGWRYNVTPYFWMAGLDGTVGVGPLSTKVDLSFGDVLDALRFGLMGYGEARVKSYVFGLDGLYISTGDSKVFAIRGDTGRFSLGQKETMLQPTVGYTFGGTVWSIDVLTGIRYWDLRTNLDVDAPERPSNERSISRNWVDATGGVRVNLMPYGRFRVLAGGDAGGGGARSSWQAYGALGADVVPWCTLSLWYRGLSVDYNHDDFLFDTNTQGLSLATTFRF